MEKLLPGLLFFVKKFLVMLFFTIVLSTPVWIRAVSVRSWKPSTKKIAISAMFLSFTGFLVYGFLKPGVNSRLSWLGDVAIVLYFIAAVVSAYFSWPRR